LEPKLLNESKKKALLARQDIGQSDKLLLILYFLETSSPVTKIRSMALSLGLRLAKKWNISAILSAAKESAVLTPNGWELTETGISHLVEKKYLESNLPKHHPVAEQLRQKLPLLKSADASKFLSEAIGCFEHGHFRASVVLSWVGAISVLQDYVIKNVLSKFNAEAVRKDPKWKIALTADDLSRMKEINFLDVLEVISVIGKNVNKELKGCLDRRNGCGHPNSLVVSSQTVAHHLEILLLNVFSKF
jgi:hypothetical protein